MRVRMVEHSSRHPGIRAIMLERMVEEKTGMEGRERIMRAR